MTAGGGDEARRCAWCGGSMEGRGPKFKTCSEPCRKENRNVWQRSRLGTRPKPTARPFPPAACVVCGTLFEQSDLRQKYCKSLGACAIRAKYQRRRDRGYYDDPQYKAKAKAIQAKWSKSPEGSAWQREYNAKPEMVAKRQQYAMTDRGKAARRAIDRKRAAQRALSLLLLPTHNPPEVNNGL